MTLPVALGTPGSHSFAPTLNTSSPEPMLSSSSGVQLLRRNSSVDSLASAESSSATQTIADMLPMADSSRRKWHHLTIILIFYLGIVHATLLIKEQPNRTRGISAIERFTRLCEGIGDARRAHVTESRPDKRKEEPEEERQLQTLQLIIRKSSKHPRLCCF
jgi:hypothetical protein